MTGSHQFAVNREGVVELASFVSFGSSTREQFVVGSDGTVDEEHLVVPGLRGVFEKGVAIRAEETGVWLIDPNTPGLELDDHTYFMDREGRVIDISTGAQVASGIGKFELHTGAIQRYEAQQSPAQTL